MTSLVQDGDTFSQPNPNMGLTSSPEKQGLKEGEEVKSQYGEGMEHQSVNAFSRQEFNMGGYKNVPQQNTFARDMDTSHVSRAQVAMSTGSQLDTGRNTNSSNIQAMMLQSGVNQAHMEIMHKQQVLKETCDLPFIFLSESDEKELFDLAVALKFGNQQTIF